jgi:hypothetical protein
VTRDDAGGVVTSRTDDDDVVDGDDDDDDDDEWRGARVVVFDRDARQGGWSCARRVVDVDAMRMRMRALRA